MRAQGDQLERVGDQVVEHDHAPLRRPLFDEAAQPRQDFTGAARLFLDLADQVGVRLVAVGRPRPPIGGGEIADRGEGLGDLMRQGGDHFAHVVQAADMRQLCAHQVDAAPLRLDRAQVAHDPDEERIVLRARLAHR